MKRFLMAITALALIFVCTFTPAAAFAAETGFVSAGVDESKLTENSAEVKAEVTLSEADAANAEEEWYIRFSWKTGEGSYVDGETVTKTAQELSTNALVAYSVTGLTAQTEYTCKAALWNDNCTPVESDEFKFTTAQEKSMTNNEASDITATTAVLTGTFTGLTEAQYEFKFAVGVKDSGVASEFAASVDGNTLRAEITGLKPGTEYGFYAFARNKADAQLIVRAVGDLSFTTLKSEPVVTTQNAQDVGITSAKLSGTAAEGDAVSMAVTEAGFEYKIANDTEWTRVPLSQSAGSLQTALTGLKANTLYSFRAYAIADGQTFFGSEAAFTTLPEPTVMTKDAENITQYSAVINGLISGEKITEFGFEFKYPGDTVWTKVTFAGQSGSISSTLTKLQANTQYAYRAYAVADGETYYGGIKTFATKPLDEAIRDWVDTTSRYNIYASNGVGGAISPSGAATVKAGSSVTYLIIPNDGYEIKDVIVDGASVGAQSIYTFTNVSSNHSIYATFVKTAPTISGNDTVTIIPATGMGTGSLLIGLGLLISGGLLLPGKKK